MHARTEKDTEGMAGLAEWQAASSCPHWVQGSTFLISLLRVQPDVSSIANMHEWHITALCALRVCLGSEDFGWHTT